MQTNILSSPSGEILYIRLVPGPLCFHAYTEPDRDGNYNIYVNADLCHEAQVEAVEHELEHIRGGDLLSELPGSVIERLRR